MSREGGSGLGGRGRAVGARAASSQPDGPGLLGAGDGTRRQHQRKAVTPPSPTAFPLPPDAGSPAVACAEPPPPVRYPTWVAVVDCGYSEWFEVRDVRVYGDWDTEAEAVAWAEDQAEVRGRDGVPVRVYTMALGGTGPVEV